MKETYHERSSTQIGTGQDNHAQTVRKDQGGNGTDQTGSILLPPRGSVGAESGSTSECEQTSGRDTAEEDLVKAHVALDGTCDGDGLDHLGGCETVHGKA